MANPDLLRLLTKREIDIIYAYCEYETIKETAAFLGRSKQTIKNNLSIIYHKLGVTKGHAAVYRLGIHEWLDVPEVNFIESDGDQPMTCVSNSSTTFDNPTSLTYATASGGVNTTINQGDDDAKGL
jgi:DNA-binding CsgD family transcriptional regulator